VTPRTAMRTRILVVEDEPAIADTICYALSTEGFEPDWRATGAAALEALAAGTEPGLIILDVGLPDINGFELFKQLVGHTRAPVIFLTARAEDQGGDQTRAAGQFVLKRQRAGKTLTGRYDRDAPRTTSRIER